MPPSQNDHANMGLFFHLVFHLIGRIQQIVNIRGYNRTLTDLSQGAAVFFSGVNRCSLLDEHAIRARRYLPSLLFLVHARKTYVKPFKAFILTSNRASPIFTFTLPLLYTSIFPMRPPGKSLILEPDSDDGLLCSRVTLELAFAASAFSSEPIFGSSTCVCFGKGRDEGNWKKSNCGVSDRTCQVSTQQ